MDSRWTLGLFGALLAAGAVALFNYREDSTMGIVLLVGIVLGTSILSFIVGVVMGYLVDR